MLALAVTAASALILSPACSLQHTTTPKCTPLMQHSGGKGFGGGEATRDPEPTVIDLYLNVR